MIPRYTDENKVLMIIIGCIIFSAIYLGVGITNLNLSVLNQAPVLFLDSEIPLIQWTVVIYLSQFIYLIYGLSASNNDSNATKAYYGYILAAVIAGIIFIIYPTSLPRVDEVIINNSNIFIIFCFKLLYLIDVPTNCLPSLHTSMALICHNSLKENDKLIIFSRVWAYSIIISTLTTKQHTLIDVFCGVLLFLFVRYCCDKFFIEDSHGASREIGFEAVGFKNSVSK